MDTRQPVSARQCCSRGLAFQLSAVCLTVVVACAATGLACWRRVPTISEPEEKKEIKSLFPKKVLKDWPKPDFVLFFSGQQHGYILPCGCSRPQIGGLERRYNFLKQIKDTGWPCVALDLGDIPQSHGPLHLPNQQGLIKYLYSMQALKTMKYSAVGFGAFEVNLSLQTVLDEWALNEPSPRILASNLLDADKNFPDQTKAWEAYTPEGTKFKVGVTSVVGPTIATKMKSLTQSKLVKFEATPNALNRVVKAMDASKVDLRVLLYQGPTSRNMMKKPYTEGMACAEAYPQFPVILCLSDEDDPPAKPLEVKTRNGTTMLVTLGKKGKYVGVLGVYKKGDGFTYRYERVELTEDFLTPEKNEKGHPIVGLMEAYTKELKDKDYLSKYGQTSHQLQVLPEIKGLKKPGKVEYVGSEVCKKCHSDAYKTWKKTPHSHAYQTLVDAKKPSNRQYDPECIVCHTVGFGYRTGFVDEKKTPLLKDVGCESCHGPSSMHVANPTDEEWQKRVNPWKYLPKNKRKDAMDQFCQRCHDIDNDVSWLHGGFKKKWPKIKHYTGEEIPFE